MNLYKGMICAVIIVISASIATVLHIPREFSFPWGMMSAAIKPSKGQMMSDDTKPLQSFDWQYADESWRVEQFAGLWLVSRLLESDELGVTVGRSYKPTWQDARPDLERDIQMWQAHRRQ